MDGLCWTSRQYWWEQFNSILIEFHLSETSGSCRANRYYSITYIGDTETNTILSHITKRSWTCHWAWPTCWSWCYTEGCEFPGNMLIMNDMSVKWFQGNVKWYYAFNGAMYSLCRTIQWKYFTFSFLQEVVASLNKSLTLLRDRDLQLMYYIFA